MQGQARWSVLSEGDGLSDMRLDDGIVRVALEDINGPIVIRALERMTTDSARNPKSDGCQAKSRRWSNRKAFLKSMFIFCLLKETRHGYTTSSLPRLRRNSRAMDEHSDEDYFHHILPNPLLSLIPIPTF